MNLEAIGKAALEMEVSLVNNKRRQTRKTKYYYACEWSTLQMKVLASGNDKPYQRLFHLLLNRLHS